MKTAIITRFHYKENDPRFDFRLSYFKNAVLPRILKQADDDFDICIWCEPCHDEIFKSLSEKIKVFHAKREAVFYETSGKNGKTYYYDFVDFSELEGLEKYDLQIGLDSDDLVDENYVAMIKDCISKDGGERPLHIHFQPESINVRTGQVGFLGNYGPTRGSAFMALYQPDKRDYKFIYHRSHITLMEGFDKSILLPKGHCWASIHSYNESTGK
jgi:hypothetical protein